MPDPNNYYRDQAWKLEAEAALLREALGQIVATKNTLTQHEDGPSLSLDAERKMRAIAARALTAAAEGTDHA